MNTKRSCLSCKYYKDGYCEDLELEPKYPDVGCDDFEIKDDKNDVLDKIRAEISSLIAEYDARCNRFHHKPYKPTKGFPENGVAPRNPIEIESRKWGERAEGLERALKIIDKYRGKARIRND